MVDGDPVKAYFGETVAAALIAAGRWSHRSHNGHPLATLCNVSLWLRLFNDY